MSIQAKGSDPVDIILETQAAGEHLIKLSERSSVPLTDMQYRVLAASEVRMKWFNLRLTADLGGAKWLHSGNRVGTSRFATEDGQLIIQVDPKVQSADVFRMVDRTNRSIKTLNELSELPVHEQPISGMFLQYFANQTLAFLKRNNYRSYRFIEERNSAQVRGKPLVAEYGLRNLPNGRAHIMPTRHLELSSDVFENRVIAYSVTVALRLLSILRLTNSAPVRRVLLACQRHLVGVDPARVTAQEIYSHKYSRSSRHFTSIHRLCEILLENETISMSAG